MKTVSYLEFIFGRVEFRKSIQYLVATSLPGWEKRKRKSEKALGTRLILLLYFDNRA